jgi:Uma2 family endonuclease
MAITASSVTYEDWLRMPTVLEGREEVVNGELRVIRLNRYPYAEIVSRLSRAFIEQTDEKQVRFYGSSPGLLITRAPLTCRSPDIVVYRSGNIAYDENDIICSAPDLSIEILSRSDNKRQKLEKLDDYARIGVREAWIISPEAQTVEIRVLKDLKLVVEKIVIEGTLSPTAFPDISIPVAELWPPDLPE